MDGVSANLNGLGRGPNGQVSVLTRFDCTMSLAYLSITPFNARESDSKQLYHIIVSFTQEKAKGVPDRDNAES